MDETLEDARARDRLGREIEVLILVKTTPTPSATYEDTVCVAGLALAPGPLRWVRLYPVPFRHLHKSTRFTKSAALTVHRSSMTVIFRCYSNLLRRRSSRFV